MTDPVRLLEEGDALEVRVLQAGREEMASAALRRNVLAAGIVGAGVAAATTAVSTGVSASAGAKGVAALAVVKWVGVVAVAAVATAGVVHVAMQPRAERAPVTVVVVPPPKTAPSPTPTPGSAPDRAAVRVAAPARVVEPAPMAAAAPALGPAVPAASSLASPSAPVATDLDKELALLDTARAALDSGDTTLAIRQLDRHDLDYLHGQLAPDALALRIEVYARRGDDSKVQELSRVFLARYPDHPQVPRVRRLSSAGANP